MIPPTFGSLFAGIGGLDLGLERAGWQSVWQVEINPYARRVLEKHWPHVCRWDDARTFPPEPTAAWNCDLIAGGFPCQDISNAGKRAGINGQRSGLWYEFARIIRALRPRYVLVENVSAILVRGIGRVLGDLARIGYDAEWNCLPAAAFGAPHARWRVFVVASARGDRRSACGACNTLVSDTDSKRLEGQKIFKKNLYLAKSDWWAVEPDMDRVANGIPHRVDRIRCLGNAVVPQVAEYIGHAIMRHMDM